MIFRDCSGKLIEINKLDFKNDKLFYKKIIEIKDPSLFNDLNNNNSNCNIKLNGEKNNCNNYSNYLINKMIN